MIIAQPIHQQTPVRARQKFIDHVYFGNISVDIFSDALGFLLIFIACLNLAKVNNRFKYGSVTTLFALILHIVILALPFSLTE